MCKDYNVRPICEELMRPLVSQLLDIAKEHNVPIAICVSAASKGYVEDVFFAAVNTQPNFSQVVKAVTYEVMSDEDIDKNNLLNKH